MWAISHAIPTLVIVSDPFTNLGFTLTHPPITEPGKKKVVNALLAEFMYPVFIYMPGELL